MEKTIRKGNWLFPWQDDKIEAWLEKMSRSGMHLARPGSLSFEFAPGDPQDRRYRLDFQDFGKTKDKEEYLRLFAESGWEYLGEADTWQFFRRPSLPGEDRELFTDAESKILKYRRYPKKLYIHAAQGPVIGALGGVPARLFPAGARLSLNTMNFRQAKL